MAYEIGQKVQAVDEVGYWSSVVIKDFVSTDCYEVGFQGWSSKYDRKVNRTEVRVPEAMRRSFTR